MHAIYMIMHILCTHFAKALLKLARGIVSVRLPGTIVLHVQYDRTGTVRSYRYSTSYR